MMFILLDTFAIFRRACFKSKISKLLETLYYIYIYIYIYIYTAQLG